MRTKRHALAVSPRCHANETSWTGSTTRQRTRWYQSILLIQNSLQLTLCSFCSGPLRARFHLLYPKCFREPIPYLSVQFADNVVLWLASFPDAGVMTFSHLIIFSVANVDSGCALV
jgi:hypothetical protein